MTYLTYDEYKEIGGTLEETAFKRNIDRACGFIRNETYGRIDQMRDFPDEVKPCCRDLVEYLDANVSRETRVSSKSQSAGGVSESESYVTKTTDEINCEMQNIVYDHLAHVTNDYFVPLMYRGAIG
jgi:hypothetical protein